MSSKLFLSLLICSSLSGHAQRIEVTKGPIFDAKQVRKDFDISVVSLLSPFRSGSISTSLFFNPVKKKSYTGLGFSGKSFQFIVLDDYLNYNGVKKLTSEAINEKVNLNAFIVISSKLYVIYSQKFQDTDAFSVYVNEVSDDMVVLGSPILVHNFKDLKKYGMNVSVASSEDRKFLLITRLQDTKPKEKQRVEFKAIDSSFGEVWYRFVETENMDKDLEIRSMKVDNAGNAYMMVEYEVGKVNKPRLYAYFWNTRSLKVFDMGMGTGENFGTRMELLNGEKPYVVGLNENNEVVSYFMNRINTKTEVLENLGSSKMPEGFYEASQKRMFKTSHWNVADMIILANNSIVASIEAMILDPKYRLIHSYNAYVVSFNDDGKQNWARTIQKKQIAMVGMSGHMLVPAANNVLVLYNDDVQNIGKKPEETKVEVFKSKDAMMVVQEIDPAGKVKKYPITTDKELNGCAFNFKYTKEIEKDFYYAGLTNVKGMASVESRNMTFRVK
jgi:hypothetical protein